MHWLEILFRICVAHAVGDFALQNPDMAKYKSPLSVPPDEAFNPGQTRESVWFYFLTAHALIMGACFWAVTGLWYLGLWETMTHWLIDYGKCHNKYGVLVDQLMHMCSRVFIILVMVFM